MQTVLYGVFKSGMAHKRDSVDYGASIDTSQIQESGFWPVDLEFSHVMVINLQTHILSFFHQKYFEFSHRLFNILKWAYIDLGLSFVFLEMGLYRSRIEFLVMFEVVQHCL
jgi:hypothetical protein